MHILYMHIENFMKIWVFWDKAICDIAFIIWRHLGVSFSNEICSFHLYTTKQINGRRIKRANNVYKKSENSGLWNISDTSFQIRHGDSLFIILIFYKVHL